jgi:hypothetical protein
VLDLGRQFCLGGDEAALEFGVVEQAQRRDVAPADALERLGPRNPARLRQTLECRLHEPGRAQLALQRGGVGEAGLVDLGKRRKETAEPVGGEVLRIEGSDHDPSGGHEHTGRLGERPWAVDVLEGQPHDDPLEPAVLEGERFCVSLLEACTAPLGARLGEHLRRGVDAPHLRSAVGQSRGEGSRAAAHVERASPIQVSGSHHPLEDLPPARVGRPHAVVRPRHRAEMRREPNVRQ